MYAKYSREVNEQRGKGTNLDMVVEATEKLLMELWKRLQNPPPDVVCKSLLKRHLTHERFEELKNRKTKHGGTLAECIRSGEKSIISSEPHFTCAMAVVQII